MILALLSLRSALAQDALGAAQLVAMAESRAHLRTTYVVASLHDLSMTVTVYENGRVILPNVTPGCETIPETPTPFPVAQVFFTCNDRYERDTLKVTIGDPAKAGAVPTEHLFRIDGPREEAVYIWKSSTRDFLIEVHN